MPTITVDGHELEISADERLNAGAALPPDRISAAMAREILASASDMDRGVQDAVYRASVRLTAERADGLVEEVGRLVGEGVPVVNLLPCLTRLSDAGAARLLVAGRRAAAVLPPAG